MLERQGGTWIYLRDRQRLTVTWREYDGGADLVLVAGDRHQSRYFEDVDLLFQYHSLLERALVEARWSLAGYLRGSDVDGRLSVADSSTTDVDEPVTRGA
jgi:hypothetical protein